MPNYYYSSEPSFSSSEPARTSAAAFDGPVVSLDERDAPFLPNNLEGVPEGDQSIKKVRFLPFGKKANRIIQQPPAVSLLMSCDFSTPLPTTFSLKLPKLPLKIKSFYFGDTKTLCQEKKIKGEADENFDTPELDFCDANRKRSKHFTRLKPPKDLIKLEDRLKYLLQPPLEQLFSSRELKFPFEPFPYQWAGVGFLFPRHSAILADEMGLGKTMQSITTIRLMIRSGAVRSVLLVCPKPLVTNWKREFDVWASEIPVEIIEGDQARRKWLWELKDVPVKIANYELLTRDRNLYSPPPEEVIDETGAAKFVQGGVKFDLVVLDEAQRIKNQSGSTHKAVDALQRKRSWALTGTPVENSASDLIGIFEWLSPGYLSPEMKPSQLGRAIGDHILRRTKDKVLKDMPPRLIRDLELEMTDAQRESYKNAEENGVETLNEMGESATTQHVLQLITKLKQICNFDPATHESPKMSRLVADMEEVAASNQKAIVFTQWTHTIDQMRPYLEPFGPLEYSGRIPHRARDGVIKQFKENPDNKVILMTYGAGSVGLNLQFCNYVFLFDRWWNPAIEDQAINRAHRIGVKGSVTVSRFLLMGTIEERIDKILREKRELFETVLSGADACQKTGLSQKQIFGLFNLKIGG